MVPLLCVGVYGQVSHGAAAVVPSAVLALFASLCLAFGGMWVGVAAGASRFAPCLLGRIDPGAG